MQDFHVYILTSKSGVLYTGVTNELERRIWEHKQKLVPGFTAKYNVNLLMYYERFDDAIQAIENEKRIKGWTRAKKIKLIESMNPTWRDLSEDWTSTATPKMPVILSAAKDLDKPESIAYRDPSLRSG